MSRVPWVALALGALALAGGGLVAAVARGWLVPPPCPFKALTGLPCLTCGLTRWGLALHAGDLAGAWAWHPAATLAAAAAPFLGIRDLVRAWRNHAYRPLPQGAAARWAVGGILLLIWGVQVARGV